MEVVAASPGSGGVPPFHDHDVREWSRLDSLTGVLERARLETDHWTNNTNNSRQKYGKVVDSRARSDADGALQQQARRQLEVFQSQVPGGHLQVIKTHTVSSSRWTNKLESQTESHNKPEVLKDFENLQLSLNPLDLSSQKSKASVGRSVSRRPPTRLRAKPEPSSSSNPLDSEANNKTTINLQRVSRLCHQIHDSAVRQAFGTKSPILGHKTLLRTKSTSSEDLHLNQEKDPTKSTEDLEDLEELQNWRRTSKLRRSLQFPRLKTVQKTTSDFPDNTPSVRKIREDLEKGRRLTAALRGNTVDLQSLDQILQSISSSSSIHSDKTDDLEEVKPIKSKRNSFVTVETLQEVKGRLRRTSSPSLGLEPSSPTKEDSDDGIVTEETMESTTNPTRVRSYVFGMEAMLNKKTNLNTNSLKLNGSSTNRTEDWYNRRKSYGFEKVHNENTNTTITKNRSIVESSTDSGICRSSEIVVVPTTAKPSSFSSDEEPKEEVPSFGTVRKMASIFGNDLTGYKPKSTTTSITIPLSSFEDVKRHSIAVDESKYVQKTESRFNFGTDSDRKPKKVEFCKTEVHFAADSGKVNIVETDEKPPPTNNFRRRRRNSGPLNEFKSDLPMLRFGDTSYEKTLFGETFEDDVSTEPLYENNIKTFGVVTVNTSNTIEFSGDDRKTQEVDIKGILKNKPVKPKPYHLGAENESLGNEEDDSKWGVKLRHVPTKETPLWKSTVTVHNFEQQDEQPEFQKLLRNLRPTRNLSDSESLDNRRSSWCDKFEGMESRGYSTRIHFGDGGLATVEDAKHPTWPRKDPKDSKNLLNKGLVVRIGREDSNHIVCSKTTTSQDTNNTTTTTKITIDLSPSPPPVGASSGNSFSHHHKPSFPQTAKNDQRSQNNHSFKSTSLILNTIKDSRSDDVAVPQQLEALKKLYDEEQSDSDADKEVQRLMGDLSEAELERDDSVISGSWSKMRAFRTINQTVQKRCSLESSLQGLTLSKEKEVMPAKLRTEFKATEKLSSPFLVGKNSNLQKRSPISSKRPSSPVKKSPMPTRRTLRPDSPAKSRISSPKDFKNVPDTKLQTKHASDIVLRQPKRSEMTYFGVKVSPSPTKKVIRSEPSKQQKSKLTEKPDLLQHYEKIRAVTPPSERIYENLRKTDKKPNKYASNDFDSGILEELTKAADQIMQAVNGYTDEDSHTRLSTDEDDTKKMNLLNKQLDTIAESKSWKQQTSSVVSAKSRVAKTKTSSSESVLNKEKERKSSRRILESTTAKASTKARRLQRASSREALLQSHGSSSEDLSASIEVTPLRKPRLVKKTKATLSVTNGLEVKKTQSQSVSPASRKPEERVLNSLPEIRHKTAVSTIRSTAEKNSTRERTSRRKPMDLELNRKKLISSKTINTTKGTSSKVEKVRSAVSNNKETVTHRISTANIKKCQRTETGSPKH